MTAKEALKILGKTDASISIDEFNEAVKVLHELVERDTPMKVTHTNMGASYCPRCEHSYLRNSLGNENKFCGYCGQRLERYKITDTTPNAFL